MNNSNAELLYSNKAFDFNSLLFCRICNPTACNIRICDPQLIPIKLEIGSNRIANPIEQSRLNRERKPTLNDFMANFHVRCDVV